MDYLAGVRLEVYDAITEYATSGRLSELKSGKNGRTFAP